MIEDKVANTILEKDIEVEVNGKKHTVPPISVATLIEVSRLIAKMPWIDSNTENFLSEILRTAKDCKVLGEIAATIILGVEKKKHNFFDFFIRSNYKMKFSKLADDILSFTPKELNKLMTKLLSSIQIADFFGVTIFLSEVNLLKPTKKMVETIPSGR